MDIKTMEWNGILAGIIKQAGKPLSRKEIFEFLKKEVNPDISYNNVGVYLFNAKKAGVLAHIRIPPSKLGFYCNPEWVKNGKLKDKYSFNPYWGIV